jgi:glycosyltransferase, family 1
MNKNPKWLNGKKVAIVTDWLTTYGGAEKVVLTVSEIFPEAPIFTSQYSEKEVDWFSNKQVKTGWLNIFPAKMRKILPVGRVLYFRNLGKKLKDFDVIISICCAESKGLNLSEKQLHISYLQGPPIQYYWGMYDDYVNNPGFGKLSFLVRFFFKILVNPLRKNDFKLAQKPDFLIANSSYSKDEILKYYKRDTSVVFPPVEVDKFKLERNKKDYYITTSRQVNWKKLDLAVEAFSKNGKKLVLVGGGAEHQKLVELAGDAKNIEFIPRISDPLELSKIVAEAKGFVFPSLEPFGIAPIEALATGTPVLAFDQGGVQDYIKDGENGIFFDKQSSSAILKAVEKFEKTSFDAKKVSESAKKFSKENFKKNFEEEIKRNFNEKF